MELKAYQEKILSDQSRWSARVEIPLEAELMIPDYQPPVFKMVKTLVEPVILQKHGAAGRLILEGYLRCEIFYQSEEENQLCQVEQKCSFSRTIELPQGTVEDGLIQIWGEPEYINCRATHPRRLELRGGYELTVESPVYQEVEILTGLAQGEGEQKLCRTQTMAYLPCGDKVITAEEEIMLEEVPKSVVEIRGSIPVKEIKKAQGKALIKAMVQGEIYYRGEQNQELRKQEFSFPVRQVMDLEAMEEDTVCQGWAAPLGWSLQEGEEKSVRLSVTAMVGLRAWHTKQCVLLSDAFFPGWETQSVETQLRLEQMEKEFSEELTLDLEWEEESAAQLLAVMAQIHPPKPEAIEDMTEMAGQGTLWWFYKNQQEEIQCREQTFRYTLPGRWLGEPEDWLVAGSAQVIQTSGMLTGRKLEAELKIQVSGILFHTPVCNALVSLEKGEPKQQDPDSPSLTIYYALPGESVFQIAKTFGAAPAQLMACNNLEEDEIQSPVKLLVPQRLE